MSGERHAVTALERDTSKFESESEFMSLEDDVSTQREQGVQVMQSKKVCHSLCCYCCEWVCAVVICALKSIAETSLFMFALSRVS